MVGQSIGETLTEMPPAATADPLDNMAVLSLVLGFVAVFGLFPLIQLPAALTGLIVGVPALKSSRRNVALVGMALSAIGIVVCVWIALRFIIAIKYLGLGEVVQQLRGL